MDRITLWKQIQAIAQAMQNSQQVVPFTDKDAALAVIDRASEIVDDCGYAFRILLNKIP